MADVPKSHAPAPARAQRRMQLQRALLGFLYLCALALLVTWEFRERLASHQNNCEVSESSARSELYSKPYRALLNWASAQTAHHVDVISIPADVEEAQSSNCVGRAYLADVLRVLDSLHPAEIVIDKFYSPVACATEAADTAALRASMQAMHIPVVVGENTDEEEHAHNGVCLVQKPQLDFAAPMVRHGLTRLNEERERLPLQWPVLPEANAGGGETPETRDSLAWAAVKQFDPGYADSAGLQSLLRSDRHPYANLEIELPHSTTTALLCQAGSDAMKQRWLPNCSRSRPLPNLLGKIVVIGSERQEDLRDVLDTHVWGFDLHAMYIEDLLSGAYLRTLLFLTGFLLFALYVFVIEGVPTLLQWLRPKWKHKRFLCHAYKRRRYFWVLFWTPIFIVVIGVVTLALRYLPPLIVLGDICLVAVSRLLIFAAESTEHPLLHNHQKEHPHGARPQ